VALNIGRSLSRRGHRNRLRRVIDHGHEIPNYNVSSSYIVFHDQGAEERGTNSLYFPAMLALRRLALLTLVVAACTPQLLAAVSLPLTISKSFNPSTVLVGGTSTTTMTVTITNPNAFSVSGIAFSDTYPAGLVPDVVGSYTCSAGTAVFTGSGWSLGNVTLGAGASCNVPMLMHATIAGPIVNTTSSVTGTGVPTSGPASATLNALANIPTLSGWLLIALAMTVCAVAVIRMRG
jgi:hypothetical protein